MSKDGILFDRIAFIGIGLIGSSLALSARKTNSASHITVCDINKAHRDKALELGICDTATGDFIEAVKDADLVVICTPPGVCGDAAAAFAPGLKEGAIVSDVGSVKQAIIHDVSQHLPDGIHFVPAHPIAGTEHSGPEAGFAELFDKRWLILTPPAGTDEEAVKKVSTLWERAGSTIEVMDAQHHDMVLAITSHLPHLIAFTIVGTADDLGDHLKQEVIKFSASGFRDFTRIAASDPVMWRDVFLNNKEAVLEILQRFSEDLTFLQRAIRWGEGDKLEELFTRTREIRRDIIEANQA
ncbi:Protein TyrC [Candidatus Terasakiella magnetica]|uniref:prephenate dehydrogenase n=1 Tax=Candidatus Terasakiella magnetica TaxID=1867952 RepID=A0A1C3RE09_9PROT|nr:prephenate/arogenate dehydrogenase family protein [Candidatus Terasakiella magnetica]SCA55472.1 Protein TyrC [Candidatus Terasakiella magnetica]